MSLKARTAFFISLTLLGHLTSFSQSQPAADTSKRYASPNSMRSSLWVSMPLITLGFIANGNTSIMNKYQFKKERGLHVHIDDYIQYAPIAAIYSMDALGIRAKHTIQYQTAVLLKSELLMTAIVTPLKRITHVIRPDSSAYTSFPSGHVAQAFLGAEMLRKEYGKDHPWIAVGGYVTATAVGALRMLNNKHWLPDVIAGAGIGILSVNVIYCTHKRKDTGEKKTTFSPTFSGGQPGFYFAYTF